MLSPDEITRILDRTINLKHWTILATFYATCMQEDAESGGDRAQDAAGPAPLTADVDRARGGVLAN